MNPRIAPLNLDTSLPKGISARPYDGQRLPPRKEPRNILEQAAMCDHRDFAASLIASILKIDFDDRLMKASLSDPDRWARMSRETRLMEIGNWLRAECFELLDCVSTPHISTVGD